MLCSLFGTDLTGTRPTYLGIGKTLLADKVRGTGTLVIIFLMRHTGYIFLLLKLLYFIVKDEAV